MATKDVQRLSNISISWLIRMGLGDPGVPARTLAKFACEFADDGTEPELTAELAAWKADPQAVWGRMQTPLSDETEAKVATKVIAACDEALAELPSAETLLPRAMPAAPDAEASAELSAQQERSRLAARVMLGERAALEACQTVWNEALSKVATPA